MASASYQQMPTWIVAVYILHWDCVPVSANSPMEHIDCQSKPTRICHARGAEETRTVPPPYQVLPTTSKIKVKIYIIHQIF